MFAKFFIGELAVGQMAVGESFTTQIIQMFFMRITKYLNKCDGKIQRFIKTFLYYAKHIRFSIIKNVYTLSTRYLTTLLQLRTFAIYFLNT